MALLSSLKLSLVICLASLPSIFMVQMLSPPPASLVNEIILPLPTVASVSIKVPPQRLLQWLGENRVPYVVLRDLDKLVEDLLLSARADVRTPDRPIDPVDLGALLADEAARVGAAYRVRVTAMPAFASSRARLGRARDEWHEACPKAHHRG